MTVGFCHSFLAAAAAADDADAAVVAADAAVVAVVAAVAAAAAVAVAAVVAGAADIVAAGLVDKDLLVTLLGLQFDHLKYNYTNYNTIT